MLIQPNKDELKVLRSTPYQVWTHAVKTRLTTLMNLMFVFYGIALVCRALGDYTSTITALVMAFGVGVGSGYLLFYNYPRARKRLWGIRMEVE